MLGEAMEGEVSVDEDQLERRIVWVVVLIASIENKSAHVFARRFLSDQSAELQAE